MEKNGYLYGRAYSSKGVLLDEFQFSFDLQNTNRMMLLPEKEHVLFVQEPVYDGNNRDLLIYGMEQEQFKQIDHMPLNGLNITDISGNYANTLLHYKKDTGILHIVCLLYTSSSQKSGCSISIITWEKKWCAICRQSVL